MENSNFHRVELKNKRFRKRLIIVSLILVFILVFSILGIIVITFSSPGKNYSIDGGIQGLHDMDNDGDLDIVTVRPSISFNENGEFSKSKRLNVGENGFESEDKWHMMVADLNNDDYPDIFNYGPNSSAITIYFNDKKCNFDELIDTYDLNYRIRSFDVIDWNLDGNIDIITYPYKGIALVEYSGFTIMINNGKGIFNHSFVIKEKEFLTEMDYNLDGILDIVLIADYNLTILLRDIPVDYNYESINVPIDTPFKNPAIGIHNTENVDADLDGDIDIIYWIGGGPFLFINNNYSDFTIIEFNKYMDYSTLRLADLNNDGILDVLGYTRTRKVQKDDEACYVMFSNEDFQLSEPVRYKVGAWPLINILDIDGDGDNDIISVNFHSDSVTIRYNNGKGNFKIRKDFPVQDNFFGFGDSGNNPKLGRLKDIDHDGDVDILIGNYNGWSVTILKNDGNGQFNDLKEYPVTGTMVIIYTVEDLNGDGYEDIITIEESNAADAEEITVLFNDKHGNFQDEFLYHLMLLFQMLIAIILISFIILLIIIVRRARKKKHENLDSLKD